MALFGWAGWRLFVARHLPPVPKPATTRRRTLPSCPNRDTTSLSSSSTCTLNCTRYIQHPFWWASTPQVYPRATVQSMGIDKVYVVHYTPLVDRKRKMVRQLERFFGKEKEDWEENGFITFVEDWDREKLAVNATLLHHVLNDKPNNPYTTLDKGLLGALSASAKHWRAFFDVLHHGYERVLIMEDDVVFPKSDGWFYNKQDTSNLQTVVDALDSVHWSNCYLNDKFHRPCRPLRNDNNILCRQPQGEGSNGMVAYLLHHNGACRLVNYWLHHTIDGTTAFPDHQANAVSQLDKDFATFRTLHTWVRPEESGPSTWVV